MLRVRYPIQTFNNIIISSHPSTDPATANTTLSMDSATSNDTPSSTDPVASNKTENATTTPTKPADINTHKVDGLDLVFDPTKTEQRMAYEKLARQQGGICQFPISCKQFSD
jgi:hypothetical protein